ncbi:carboxylesterase family protein [Aquabacterium sp. A7-Y]|uniref:carboxylesterase/lipase family protein n=1 Tax=Aquabacterium sp. A7-Y TaxID=1349605 RepID=UPI00223E60CD|nr:carboxylesterase/lipase family protein [Aquabacterium sp. A7-Y]MCW7537713.1 carboxylesterase family protein [Aquabacterium sp. A7-Y]
MTNTRPSLRRRLLLLAAAMLCGTAASAEPDLAQVRTETGLLRGVVSSGHRAFLGVPYAQPPLGELRWRAPRPAQPWEGVRDATRLASPCVQAPTQLPLPRGSEDCLYLNVYTPPARATLMHRPVMVWIHGGGFVIGTGNSYDGSAIAAREDAVVVTINYRLGPLGFLGLPELAEESRDGSRGNYGLQDQQAALRWVQRNIAAFGGDPDRVTIFGESAGGASVLLHLVSPQSRGLFHRGVVQSSPGANGISVASREAARTGDVLAERLACTEPAGRLACLRAKPAEAVSQAGGAYAVELFVDSESWAPVADGRVVPVSPDHALKSGRLQHVPVMIGTTRDEGRLFVALMELRQQAALSEAQYREVLERFAGETGAQRVMSRYPSSAYGGHANLALSAMLTDALFACPNLETYETLSRWVPTWAYEFDDPQAPAVLVESPYMPSGSAHGTEIPYIFQINISTGLPPQFAPAQQVLSDQMRAYWAALARIGAPKVSGAAKWPTFRVPTKAVQHLSPDGIGTLKWGTFEQIHQCDFWGALPGAKQGLR